MHIGRSFTSTFIEDECPCEQAPCGLVEDTNISPDCTEHPYDATKTMRQVHSAEACAALQQLKGQC